MSDLLLVLAAQVAVVIVAMTVTALSARKAGRVSVVDTAWGLALAAVAITAAVAGTLLDSGAPWRSWLIAGLVTAWGVRLSVHMHRRNAGHGEDPRYAEFLEGAGPLARILKVWVTQGAAVLLVGLPTTVAAVTTGGCVLLAVTGVALWTLGVSFEAIGDAQLARFKADPANKGRIMDRGLWSWTRHPNYFGDACVWWGIWLLSLTTVWSLLTVVGPLAMTYFLVWATGARLLEKHMAGRPGWDEYAARTSFFLPRPPRRRGRHT